MIGSATSCKFVQKHISMEFQDVMAQLEEKGNEQTKKTLGNHGAKEPFFGVKVQDLKVILKGRKNNQELAEQLYATGNTDAMYLAGLMANKDTISKDTIQKWAEEAYWYYLNEYTVPWIAADSPYGQELAMKWIEDSNPQLQASGWSTLGSLLITDIPEEWVPDTELVKRLMKRVEAEIHDMAPRVRFTMNNFIIAAGGSNPELTELAKATAKNIGKVTVEMPNPKIKCKVPDAVEYIEKIENRGAVGKKRKSARC